MWVLAPSVVIKSNKNSQEKDIILFQEMQDEI